MLKNTLF